VPGGHRRGPRRELDRLLARQTGHVGAKPILEINTRHPLVKALADAKLAARDGMWRSARLLFDQAQIPTGRSG